MLCPCYFNINSETDILSVSSYLYFSNSKHINLYPRIGIRYISHNENFDYAEFGNYFFLKKYLYVITNKVEYKRFDVKREFYNSIYYNFIKANYYIIRVIYAGFNTGFEDSLGYEIFSGDVIKYSWNGNESTGVVADSIVWGKWWRASLADLNDIELIGNIFFNLDKKSKVDINFASRSIGEYGFIGCSDLNNVQNVKSFLTSKKTPSFIYKNWFSILFK